MAVSVRAAGRTEHDLQSAVVTWAMLHRGKWPALRLLFAIPNGAAFGSEQKTLRSGKSVPVAAIRARRMKQEGLRPGVPDLMLPVARGGFHGLFIEMKTPTGSTRPEQMQWLHDLQAEGYKCVICRSDDDAVRVLREYVGG